MDIDEKIKEKKKESRDWLTLFALALILAIMLYGIYTAIMIPRENCTLWIEKGSNATYLGTIWKYAGEYEDGWQLIESDSYDLKKVAKCKEAKWI